MSERKFKSRPAPNDNRLQARAGAPTLQDVAARAGVSPATASRCLNAPARVRPASRARVEQAIAELGYVMRGSARALKTQRSFTVGAIIPTIDNAIFARGVQSLQNALMDAGYTLLLASSNYDPERELEQARSLVVRGIDAMMLVGEYHAPALYTLLDQMKIPFVNTWTYHASGGHPCVGFDNQESAAQVASYLLDLGHRNIAAAVGVTAGNDRQAERLAGVRAALARHGLNLAPGGVLECRFTISDGRQAMRHLMSLNPRPTAVICAMDVLAFGALFECRDMGIGVPEEVSVTGFDDLELSSELKPALTTVRVPSEDMGRRAAEYLLARIAGESPPKITKLATSLVVRDSTGPRIAAGTNR